MRFGSRFYEVIFRNSTELFSEGGYQKFTANYEESTKIGTQVPWGIYFKKSNRPPSGSPQGSPGMTS